MKTILLDQSTFDETLREGLHVLRHDGIVVVPSDTVYGLAVNAMSEAAVEKLTRFKSRPVGKPISVFMKDLDDASHYVHMTDNQRNTLTSMLPGSYTVVLPSKGKTASGLESEAHTLGIRVLGDSFVKKLVEAFGKPITATSANIAGQSPHYSVQSFVKSLSKRKADMVDLIIDAGTLPIRKPSTVVDLSGGTIKTLRHGDAPAEGGNTYVSGSQKETRTIAEELIKRLLEKSTAKPIVVLLYGDLGAGKTEFVRGIAAHLGADSIVSPTFVIYYEYPLNKSQARNLYHFDLYRLQDDEEFSNLGISEMLQPGNVLCIEWSEKAHAIAQELKEKAVVVEVHIDQSYEDTESRKITIKEL